MTVLATASEAAQLPAGSRLVLRDRHEFHRIAAKAGASTLSGEHLLPVSLALREVLPARGLQRGSTILIEPRGAQGSTTFALEMLAGPSVAGNWCAVAGSPELGLVAAGERGIELGRLLLVPSLGPAERWLQVVATLFDAVDVVLLVPPASVRPADARRLAARSRERGSVLVVLDHHGSWPAVSDLRCTVVRSQWSGLQRGWGLLTGRSYEVEVSGRGAAARPLRSPMRLPA